MVYYVYIIKNLNDESFYTGLTNDLQRRLSEHNGHKNSTKSTLSKTDYILIHAEQHNSKLEARKREKFWKSGYGRELRNKITKNLGSVAQW